MHEPLSHDCRQSEGKEKKIKHFSVKKSNFFVQVNKDVMCMSVKLQDEIPSNMICARKTHFMNFENE